MKESSLWELASLLCIAMLAIVVSRLVDGWQYWLIGVLALLHGSFRSRAGKSS